MKILVADDDEFMRLLLSEVLTEAGHEVVAAADGGEAWNAYERQAYPLVLLDWQMPVMDGLEVCRRIQATDTNRETFVVVITARDESDDLVAVLDAGADDYLSKPVTPENLRARISIAERRILQEGARRRAEEALAKALRLAAIGETTLALQHEINNPLAAIIGNVTLIESGVCTGDELRDCITVIANQARRIGEVVKRLSALKDPQSVEYTRGNRMLDLKEKG